MLGSILFVFLLALRSFAQDSRQVNINVAGDLNVQDQFCLGDTQCLSAADFTYLRDLSSRVNSSNIQDVISFSNKLNASVDNVASFASSCLNSSSICQLRPTAPIISINPTQIVPGFATMIGSNIAMQTTKLSMTNTMLSNNSTCSYMSLGPVTLNLGSLGVTLAVRFQFTGATTRNYERIIDFFNGLNGVRDLVLARAATASKIRLYLEEDGVNQFVEPTYTFNQNTIYDLIVTYDPTIGTTGRVNFNVNGTNVFNQTLTNRGTDKLYANTWIGRSSVGVNDYCTSMDIFSLKVYNRALNASDISF